MFRFTIRDVLWLTVAAALVTCWYKDRQVMAVTMAKGAADLATERAGDKAKLKRELERLAFMQKQLGRGTQILRVIDEAHEREVAGLKKEIYELEGPGYADEVEPTEVAGMGIEWWADRARYFERKVREAEHSKASQPGRSDSQAARQ